MDQPCDTLEKVLFSDQSTHADRMARVARLENVASCILHELRRALERCDWGRFEIYLHAAFQHPTQSMTTVLCMALDLHSREVPNEDIVEVLGEISDPAAVSSLESALWWQPEWDEFHNLAVKCVWALAAIGSPEARTVLRDAAQTGPTVVREVARTKLATARDERGL